MNISYLNSRRLSVNYAYIFLIVDVIFINILSDCSLLSIYKILTFNRMIWAIFYILTVYITCTEIRLCFVWILDGLRWLLYSAFLFFYFIIENVVCEMKTYAFASTICVAIFFLILVDLPNFYTGWSEVEIIRTPGDDYISVYDFLCKLDINDNLNNNGEILVENFVSYPYQGEPVTCSICLEEIQNGTNVYEIPCRHIFHIDCISVWRVYSSTCPVCRVDMV